MEPSDALLIWRGRHHGILTLIAQEIGVSPQFVHLVLRGERSSTGGRVERLLRAYGAPLPDPDTELTAQR